MPRKLTLEERKFILKRYWKTENAQDVIRDWNHYFNTDPPTRLAIYKLRDKFDDTGSVADAPRSGRPSVDHDLCTKVCHSVVSRCRECIEAEGLQFEYLS